MGKPEAGQRTGYLDILRGFGIIFIVAGHIIGEQSSAVRQWFYSFHVPLFFFAAGAVYKKRTVPFDLRRRVSTVLVPYFAFGAAELVYWQLLERRFRPSEMSFPNAVLGLFCGRIDMLDFNSHLWFLPCFFITVVFYNILMNLGGKKLALSVSAAMSAVFVIVPMPEMFWGVNRVFGHIGFYALGNVVSDIKLPEKIQKQPTALKLLGAAFLISSSVSLSYFGLVGGVMRFVTAMIGTGGIFVLSIAINKNAPLQYVGRITLVILCLHGAVYRVLIKIISLVLQTETEAVRSNPAGVLVVTAITIAFCAGVHELIAKGKSIRSKK